MVQPSKAALLVILRRLLDDMEKLESAKETAKVLLAAAEPITPSVANVVVNYITDSAATAVQDYFGEGAPPAENIVKAREALRRAGQLVGMGTNVLTPDEIERLKVLFKGSIHIAADANAQAQARTARSVSDPNFQGKQLSASGVYAKPVTPMTPLSERATSDGIRIQPVNTPRPGESREVISMMKTEITSRMNTPTGGAIRGTASEIPLPSFDDVPTGRAGDIQIARRGSGPEFYYWMTAALSLGVTMYMIMDAIHLWDNYKAIRIAVSGVSSLSILAWYAYTRDVRLLKWVITFLIIGTVGYLGRAYWVDQADRKFILARTITARDRLVKVQRALSAYFELKNSYPLKLEELIDPKKEYFPKSIPDPEAVLVDPFSQNDAWFRYQRYKDQYVLQSRGPQGALLDLEYSTLFENEDAPSVDKQLSWLTYDPTNGTWSDGNFFAQERLR